MQMTWKMWWDALYCQLQVSVNIAQKEHPCVLQTGKSESRTLASWYGCMIAVRGAAHKHWGLTFRSLRNHPFFTPRATRGCPASWSGMAAASLGTSFSVYFFTKVLTMFFVTFFQKITMPKAWLDRPCIASRLIAPFLLILRPRTNFILNN